MFVRVLLILQIAFLAFGQQQPLKGWLLGWSKEPNLPLLHYGNKSYYLGVNYKADFLQAMQFCDIVYMKLLTIESEEENNFIEKIITEAKQGTEYWTSGSSMLDAKNWVWMSNGKAMDYEKFALTEPSTKTEYCAKLWRSPQGLVWYDVACHLKYNFICERRNDEPVATKKENTLPVVSPNIHLLHFNGKSYYISRKFKATFLQAAFLCRSMHMTLATINSEEENNAIERYVRETNLDTLFWIGGTRVLDNMWTWLANGQHINYTNWAKGQPNNWANNENCIQLTYNKIDGLRWDDKLCTIASSFICERKDAAPKVYKREIDEVSDDDYMEEVKLTPPGMISSSYASGKKFHVQTYLQGTQHQAEMFCNYHGLQLVVVDTEDKNQLVSKVIADTSDPGPYWTSGKKIYNKWYWGNNKPIDWKPSSDPDKNCLEITVAGEWKNTHCKYSRPFVCEKLEKEKYPEPEPPKPDPKPVKKCQTTPIVNVYIDNNLVEEGVEIKQDVSKGRVEAAYTLDVVNHVNSDKKI